jgi:hypothetical protein
VNQPAMTPERRADVRQFVESQGGGNATIIGSVPALEMIDEIDRQAGEIERLAAAVADAAARASNLKAQLGDADAALRAAGTHPDLDASLLAFIARRILDRAEVPAEANGQTLSLVDRFHLMMDGIDHTYRLFKPFVDLVSTAEEVNPKNFVTASVTYRGHSWEYTVRMVDGKAPATIIEERERERDAAIAALSALVAAVDAPAFGECSMKDDTALAYDDLHAAKKDARRVLAAGRGAAGAAVDGGSDDR